MKLSPRDDYLNKTLTQGFKKQVTHEKSKSKYTSKLERLRQTSVSFNQCYNSRNNPANNKTVRISSKLEENDPKHLQNKLALNRFDHIRYNPSVFTRESVNSLKSVLQSKSPDQMHKRAQTLEPLKLKKKRQGTLKVITEGSPLKSFQKEDSVGHIQVQEVDLGVKIGELEQYRKMGIGELKKLWLEQLSPITRGQVLAAEKKKGGKSLDNIIRRARDKEISLGEKCIEKINNNLTLDQAEPRLSFESVKKIRDIKYQQYNKQMARKNTLVVRQPPEYLSYFAFKKEQDSKQLAKMFIKGELNFEEEDKRLDKMLFSILTKTEKYKVKCFNDAKRRKNFAKTTIPRGNSKMQTETSYLRDQSNLDLCESGLMLPSIQENNQLTQESEIVAESKEQLNRTVSITPEDIFATEESKILLSDRWTVKKQSPQAVIRFGAKIQKQDNLSMQRKGLLQNLNKLAVKDILVKVNQNQVKIPEGQFSRLKSLDKEKKKLNAGLKKYMDIQKSNMTQTQMLDKSVQQIIEDDANAKEEDRKNFTGKAVVEQVQEEIFQSSHKISCLLGGQNRKVWQPSKFSFQTRLQKA